MPGDEAEESNRVAGAGEERATANRATSDVANAKVASAEWKKAAQDEFVRRVQDAVGGTLSDVRPSKKTEEGP